MKFLTPVIGSLLFAGFLVGCSEEKAKTVEYYKQNIPEAETRSKECKAAKLGAVNAEITIEINDQQKITAIITNESAQD
uniref:EexN family lipoprotein n=1 Tax=Campylobacter fetus TaxID=196 RepID=UPI0013D7927A